MTALNTRTAIISRICLSAYIAHWWHGRLARVQCSKHGRGARATIDANAPAHGSADQMYLTNGR